MRDGSEITTQILFIKEDITLRTQELILLLNHPVMDVLIETISVWQTDSEWSMGDIPRSLHD